MTPTVGRYSNVDPFGVEFNQMAKTPEIDRLPPNEVVDRTLAPAVDAAVAAKSELEVALTTLLDAYVIDHGAGFYHVKPLTILKENEATTAWAVVLRWVRAAQKPPQPRWLPFSAYQNAEAAAADGYEQSPSADKGGVWFLKVKR